MSTMVLKYLANVISNQTIGFPVFLSRLSILSWATQVSSSDLMSDISQIDPNFINDYRYNPNDGRWYESPPQPDYGQFGWMNPADAKTQGNLTFLRDLAIAWRTNSDEGYNTFYDKYPNDVSHDSVNLIQISNLEEQIAQSFNDGLLDQQTYNNFTQGFSDWLVYGTSSNLLPGLKDYNFGLDFNTPIGAFYDSQSTVNDTSPSIAAKTPVLLDSDNNGLYPALLAALDSNADGKLSGGELLSLQAWADSNENGVAKSGEITALSELGISEIRAGDYGFYTRGSSVRIGAAPLPPTKGADTPPAPVSQPAAPDLPAVENKIESVPASNYRTLRDNGNAYRLYGQPWIWVDPNNARIMLIKITEDEKHIVGTDGADVFDIRILDSSPFNAAKVTDFLGGNGNDKLVGGAKAYRKHCGRGTYPVRLRDQKQIV